jgi:putative ABC transport system ATP-binding protein
VRGQPGSAPTGYVELELVDAAVTYPGAIPVAALRPARLVIAAGEMLAVVGRSGSGKSTLLNVLGTLDRPTAGRYLVRGVDTGLLDEPATAALRGAQFGFVFQAFHLLPGRTAAENAELGLRYQAVPGRQRRERAADALARVGLAHRLQALPGTLSGEERQRVAIARAIAQGPRVLLCDEPTGSLDSRSSGLIMELLAALHASGLTIVVVTHDPSIAEGLPRCLTMEDGAVLDGHAVGGSQPNGRDGAK